VRFHLNGSEVSVDVPPMARLLDVLREACALPGTKEGCGEGECGACTVLINHEAVCSCLIPAAQAEGTSVTTIEGLGQDHAMARAFMGEVGAQCGICTPGMLMSARAYLDAGGAADDDAIREAIAGNLCRCTGYTKIVEAIAIAAQGRGA